MSNSAIAEAIALAFSRRDRKVNDEGHRRRRRTAIGKSARPPRSRTFAIPTAPVNARSRHSQEGCLRHWTFTHVRVESSRTVDPPGVDSQVDAFTSSSASSPSSPNSLPRQSSTRAVVSRSSG